MTETEAMESYERIKYGRVMFDEAKHCTLLLQVMANPEYGTFSRFCTLIGISDRTFYRWAKEHDIFLECWALGKMFSRENWEKEGKEFLTEEHMAGTASHKFEYWRMIGWMRFGIGKNSRIRLNLDPKGTPNEHYEQLIEQASQGDFTAGEIKQLMEAVNVGLNTHQVFKLQQEINDLRDDLVTMGENSNVHNSFSDKRIT